MEVVAVPAAVCRWGAMPALSWCGEVSFGGIHIIIIGGGVPLGAVPALS